MFHIDGDGTTSLFGCRRSLARWIFIAEENSPLFAIRTSPARRSANLFRIRAIYRSGFLVNFPPVVGAEGGGRGESRPWYDSVIAVIKRPVGPVFPVFPWFSPRINIYPWNFNWLESWTRQRVEKNLGTSKEYNCKAVWILELKRYRASCLQTERTQRLYRFRDVKR